MGFASLNLTAACPTGDQEVPGWIPAGSCNILFVWIEMLSTVILSLLLIQEGSCQFLAWPCSIDPNGLTGPLNLNSVSLIWVYIVCSIVSDPIPWLIMLIRVTILHEYVNFENCNFVIYWYENMPIYVNKRRQATTTKKKKKEKKRLTATMQSVWFL